MLNCSLPHAAQDRILMSHGAGGRLAHDLIEHIIKPRIHGSTAPVDPSHDAALLTFKDRFMGESLNEFVRDTDFRIGFSTDSYVVTPRFFPGGNIGELAIYGTINDLAMAGTIAQSLSCSFILEEGFLISELKKIAEAIGKAAQRCHVQIVTGDTKVVAKGQADGLYINTAGIGHSLVKQEINRQQIQPGDQIIISGDIGRHSLAIMAERQGLQLSSSFVSDLQPLHDIVFKLLNLQISNSKIHISCLRDITRGGLASSLYELQDQRKLGMKIHQNMVPIRHEVMSLCELMGYNPLQLANEGCFLIFCRSEGVPFLLDLLHSNGFGEAQHIGEVHSENSHISIINSFGVERIIEWPLGLPLPRIC